MQALLRIGACAGVRSLGRGLPLRGIQPRFTPDISHGRADAL